MKRFLAGISSLAVLLALVVGIPALLLLFAGNPIPSMSELSNLVSRPDYDGHFFLHSFLPIVGWLAWASFALALLIEFPARVRGRQARRLPLLGGFQAAAGALLTAVILLFAGFGGAAAIAEPVAPTVATVTAQASTSMQQAEIPVAVAVSTQTQPSSYTVVPGDSLWSIAQSVLGDGNRYPELLSLNEGIVQHDGRTLVEPGNLIRPGWVLTLPSSPATATTSATSVPSVDTSSATGATHQADVTQQPADQQSDASTSQESNSSVTGSGGETPLNTAPLASSSAVDGNAAPTSSPVESTGTSSVAPSADENDAWVDEILNIRTLGGIAGIAAAGILGLLGWRRLRQHKARKPGQRLTMPEDDAAAFETELRAVENPHGIEDVDHALRYLGQWAQDNHANVPSIYALRLSATEIALYLDEPAELPAPFVVATDDQMAWTVVAAELPPLDRVPSSPYPALVTLGHDDTSASLMIDLEHVSALNIDTADAATSQAALTALAVELAANPWSEDLQITLVGFGSELPAAIDTGRLEYVEDIDSLLTSLHGQASANQAAVAALGAESVPHARSLTIDAESWPPEVVLLGSTPTPEQASQLAALATQRPRMGIATVAGRRAFEGEWTLSIDARGVGQLDIPAAGGALRITPQLMTADEYHHMLSLFQASETLSQPLPVQSATEDARYMLESSEVVDVPEVHSGSTDWIETIDQFVPLRPQSASLDPVEKFPLIIHELEDMGETGVGDPYMPNPALRGAVVPKEDLRPALDVDGPWIRFLGRVELMAARGPVPRTPKTAEVNRSAVQRATELIAYLTLQPGASAVEIHNAIWPGNNPHGDKAQMSRNGLTSKARKWLGADNTDGAPFFPPVGADGYRLHGVTSDWEQFEALVGEQPELTSTDLLVKALMLVDGQPFSGVKEKYYAWAERYRQEMIAKVGDTAHELAERALEEGDSRQARWASAIAREVEPENELHWRDALRAEFQAGALDELERVWGRLAALLKKLDEEAEPEPETRALYDQLRAGKPQAAA